MAEELEQVSPEIEEDASEEAQAETAEDQPVEETASVPETFSVSELVDEALEAPKNIFSWIVGGKVRLSIAAGIFAAVMVANGFLIFDMRQAEWQLEQMYPEALTSYERHVFHARDLISSNRYFEAEQVLRRLLKRRDGGSMRADAMFLLAQCLDETERSMPEAAEARTAFDRFIKAYPADTRVPIAHRRIAENYSRHELHNDSNARYAKLLRINPITDERAEIEFAVAYNLFRRADFKAAIDSLNEIRQKYPGTVAANDSSLLLARVLKEVERVDEADGILSEILSRTRYSSHGANALALRADMAAASGAYDRSVMHATQWLKESPFTENYDEVMLILARSKLEQGMRGEAELVISDIIAFSDETPKLSEAYFLQARTFQEMGQTEKAESSYLESIRVLPENPKPHVGLAGLYRSVDNLQDAVAEMQKACDIAPRNDSYIIELAELHLLNDDIVSAEKLLTEFTRKWPLSVHIGQAFLMLAEMQLDMDKPQSAYNTLNRLLANATTTVKDYEVYEKQADILARVGLYDDALEAYAIALDSGADEKLISLKLAETLFVAEKPEECIAELDSMKHLALSPKEKFYTLDLKTRALMQLERYSDARRLIKDAIALRSQQEKFSTLALLMQANLALEDYERASKVYGVTLELVQEENTVLPAGARTIVLDWSQHLYDQGKYKAAAEAYSNIVSPGFPLKDAAWALYQLGNCHFHMDDYSTAGEAYNRLSKEFPDSEWVSFALQKTELMELKAGA